MKDKILLYIICIFAIIGCNDDMPVVMPEDSNKVTQEHHGVPLKDALEQLEDFLITVDQPTRSGEVRRIGNIDVLRSRDITTRSVGAGATNIDSLIYIVNFEDNQGFAYLAADDRISAPIIFIADSGSASTMSFGEPLQIETRTIYPEYPTTGAGTFQIVNDTINEWFMNPNTFSLYDSSYNDYLVGDFFYGGENEYDDMIQQVNDYVFNFIDNDLSGGIEDNGNPGDFGGVDWDGDDDGGGSIGGITYTHKVEENYVDTTIFVPNMLGFANGWHQYYPFNDKYPKVRKFILFGDKKNAPAGCVPLAIAKIMTFHQKPANYAINGNSISWFGLNKSFFDVPAYREDISTLLYHIASSCGSLFFYEGTFTFPSLAAGFLQSVTYSGVSYKNYNDTDVITMLNNGCPVFVCSVPKYGFLNYDLARSHAWNLDGYLQRTTTTYIKYFNGEFLVKTVPSTKQDIMVHCDWGWGGVYNGYFISGVFDLGGEDVIFDPDSAGPRKTNFNWYQKIIYYNI